MMIASEIEYLYRDASNYKFRSTFRVTGTITIQRIVPYLIDGEYFIPPKIGIASLTPLCATEDDHMLHEIEGIRCIEADAHDLTSDVFFSRLAHANNQGWFSG